MWVKKASVIMLRVIKASPKSIGFHARTIHSSLFKTEKSSHSETEGLIAVPIEPHLTTVKPTCAREQVDTLETHNILKEVYTPNQSTLIAEILLRNLDSKFYEHYNEQYLRKTELENAEYKFNSAESDLRFDIQRSREEQFNEFSLSLLKLERDLIVIQDELNELLINLLKNDSRVEFNEHKQENTLLMRSIKLKLKDLDNKISTKIIGVTRTHIESLRWHTTRSGLTAVVMLVFFIMSGAALSKRINAAEEAKNKPVEIILTTVTPEDDLGDLEEELK